MPLTYPRQGELEVVERWIAPSPAQNFITADWAGKYNLLYLPSEYPEEPLARPLYLAPDVTTSPNAEIIIRNYGYPFSSDAEGEPLYPNAPTGRAIHVLPIDGAWIEYANDGVLGPYIQRGGIMELKRLGNSNTWSAYGYIFAYPNTI